MQLCCFFAPFFTGLSKRLKTVYEFKLDKLEHSNITLDPYTLSVTSEEKWLPSEHGP